MVGGGPCGLAGRRALGPRPAVAARPCQAHASLQRPTYTRGACRKSKENSDEPSLPKSRSGCSSSTTEPALFSAFTHTRSDARLIPGKGELVFLGIPREEVKQMRKTIPFKKKNPELLTVTGPGARREWGAILGPGTVVWRRRPGEPGRHPF